MTLSTEKQLGHMIKFCSKKFDASGFKDRDHIVLVYINNNEPQHEISNNVVCATSKGSDQPSHMRSLIRAFVSRLNIL